MLISEIANRVIEETGRPDLQDFIVSVVTSSVKQMHASANFVRDQIEEIIKVPAPAPTVRLTLPPRFRKFQNVAIVDQYGRPISEAEQSSPSKFLGDFNKMPQRPAYYVTGNTYTVMNNRELLPIHYLYVLYYQHPPIDNLGQGTWITEQYPEVVINYCNFKVHSKTGNEARSREAYLLYEDGMQEILTDQLIGM